MRGRKTIWYLVQVEQQGEMQPMKMSSVELFNFISSLNPGTSIHVAKLGKA